MTIEDKSSKGSSVSAGMGERINAFERIFPELREAKESIRKANPYLAPSGFD